MKYKFGLKLKLNVKLTIICEIKFQKISQESLYLPKINAFECIISFFQFIILYVLQFCSPKIIQILRGYHLIIKKNIQLINTQISQYSNIRKIRGSYQTPLKNNVFQFCSLCVSHFLSFAVIYSHSFALQQHRITFFRKKTYFCLKFSAL